MRIVKSIEDIGLLRVASAVKCSILQEIEEQFNHIYENLGEGLPIKEFSLRDSGIIVLLERGDNVADMEEIGLNPDDRGLIGAAPEWINEQVLSDCRLINACIPCNNEYVLSIFLERGKFGQKVENWINENM